MLKKCLQLSYYVSSLLISLSSFCAQLSRYCFLKPARFKMYLWSGTIAKYRNRERSAPKTCLIFTNCSHADEGQACLIFLYWKYKPCLMVFKHLRAIFQIHRNFPFWQISMQGDSKHVVFKRASRITGVFSARKSAVCMKLSVPKNTVLLRY